MAVMVSITALAAQLQLSSINVAHCLHCYVNNLCLVHALLRGHRYTRQPPAAAAAGKLYCSGTKSWPHPAAVKQHQKAAECIADTNQGWAASTRNC